MGEDDSLSVTGKLRVAEDHLAAARERMVEGQLVRRGVIDERVLAAFRRVPREAFVSAELAEYAYDDNPLPIGEGQTISQPYVVALMAEAAGIGPEEKVLEVGAGSGYAAAILAELAMEVVTIERHASLAEGARRALATARLLERNGGPRRRVRAAFQNGPLTMRSSSQPARRLRPNRSRSSWQMAGGWSSRSASIRIRI